MIAASATRKKTSVNGGSSRSTTPLKKNDPPHSTDNAASSDQSRASIRPSVAGIFQRPAETCGRLDLPAAAVHPISGQLSRSRDDLDHRAFIVIRNARFRRLI